MKKKKLISCVFVFIFLLLLTAGGTLFTLFTLFTRSSGSHSGSISKSGFYFNTIITVSLYDSSDEALLDGCFDLAAQYESYFSNTVEGSDISKINASGGAPVTVHEETAELLKKDSTTGS